MRTNLQSTVTVKNAITLLMKEVISIRFDQNLLQGQKRTRQRRRSRKSEVKYLVYVMPKLFVVTKCYSYSKIV
jgi:hypothetical protein